MCVCACLCTHFISFSLAQSAQLFVTQAANTHRYLSSSIFISINYLNAQRRMQCVLCVRKSNLLLIFGKISVNKNKSTKLCAVQRREASLKEINGTHESSAKILEKRRTKLE